MVESGPVTAYSQELHQQKYRAENETFREAMGRISHALADRDRKDHYHEFRDALLGMRFLPAGRIQQAAGAGHATTPYNCFVSGTIADSFTVGDGNIMQRLTEAATTMRAGGGIGYDFSTLRPRGSLIRKLGSKTGGPLKFMGLYDALCDCVASAGHRRGAQMGVMRVDHPDIEYFIRAKHDEVTLRGFNISIAVTDEFMEAVAGNKPFALRWGGEIYKEVDAAELWETIMRSTWDWAEPGVLFIDRINRMNNLWYCETIAATNPCGEQPLPPFGACLLGSFNLVKYLSKQPVQMVPRRDCGWSFDWDQLQYDIPIIVRAMDNVVDRARYPLNEQEDEARSKRRMGLGVTGLANVAEAMGMPYGSPEFLTFEETLLGFINAECYRASIELAKEKGPFARLERDLYLSGGFAKTLHEDIRDGIAKHGIRNSHLTSIAPTGTISLCADNVSSGIEPVFSHGFERTVIEFEGPRREWVDDYGVKFLDTKGRKASEVTPEEHLNVLTVAQANVDSAVSKTCNVPPSTDWDTFKGIYFHAWQRGAKGCTTFNTGGRRAGILVETKKEEPDEKAEACFVDPVTGARDCG